MRTGMSTYVDMGLLSLRYFLSFVGKKTKKKDEKKSLFFFVNFFGGLIICTPPLVDLFSLDVLLLHTVETTSARVVVVAASL